MTRSAWLLKLFSGIRIIKMMNGTEPEVDSASSPKLHPRAMAGIVFFNHGHFFEAHEELEAAWRAEPGELRNLYRGILQVAVAYHHLERNNFAGAHKVFQRSRRWLDPFHGKWFGIDITRFKQDTAGIETLAGKATPTGKFIPPAVWPPPIEIEKDG